MSDFESSRITVTAFLSDYEHHITDTRGLSSSTCALHLRIARNLLLTAFPSGEISWPELQFGHVVEFLAKEFERLPNHWTQKVSLMAVRYFLRYAASVKCIPPGWEAALLRKVNRKHISLPRFFSRQETQRLWDACSGKGPRDLRNRALLLLFTRLGLRAEEVAGLSLADIDWREGMVSITGTKTRQDRILPLPWDVGEGLVAYLRVKPPKSSWLFEPLRPPFEKGRVHNHVRNSMAYLFARACLPHARLHSLRHTAATAMVNSGASFKGIADVLGHKYLASTLIYAKLDMNALAAVCLPWPGGAR